MRGMAGRYVGWQAVDRTLPRVLACVIISAALILPTALTPHGPNFTAERAEGMLTSMYRQFISVFALIIAAGIIAQDRTQGWYRVYFAKPVNPGWFYAQSIALAWLGMLVTSAVFLGLFHVAVYPVWKWSLLPESLVMFALTGMLVVAWSTRLRYDWVAAIATLAVIGGIRQGTSDHPAAARVANALLPPTHLIGVGRPLTTLELLWIGGWSALLLAITLVTLWRRPAGEG